MIFYILEEIVCQVRVKISTSNHSTIRKYFARIINEANKQRSIISVLLGQILEQHETIKTLLNKTSEILHMPKWSQKLKEKEIPLEKRRNPMLQYFILSKNMTVYN